MKALAPSHTAKKLMAAEVYLPSKLPRWGGWAPDRAQGHCEEAGAPTPANRKPCPHQASRGHWPTPVHKAHGWPEMCCLADAGRWLIWGKFASL